MGTCSCSACSCCQRTDYDSSLLYIVSFADNELGLFGSSDANRNNFFVAKCVTSFAKQSVIIGSQIVAINGKKINGNVAFDSIGQQLSKAKKSNPFSVTFKKPPEVELPLMQKSEKKISMEGKTTEFEVKQIAEEEKPGIKQTHIKQEIEHKIEEDHHIIRIDFFNTIAIELIKYKIAPFLFAYQQIGLSRVNTTFYKLFRKKTFDAKRYQSFDSQYWLEHFAIYTKEEHKGFMTKHCNKVGTCAYKQFSKHEVKMLLYFLIFYVMKIRGLHLWCCHWNPFFPAWLYHSVEQNYFEYLTFSDMFNHSLYFKRTFIEPFYVYKCKFSRLTHLNLDFNEMGDDNCVQLFGRCIVPSLCPRLEELNIAHTNISDKSCRAIADFYSNHVSHVRHATGQTKLNRIILNDNYKITTRGVDELNRIFKYYSDKSPLNDKSTAFEIKNKLNKRNWRLYSPSWHKCIITGYKPPPPRPKPKPKPKPKPTYTSSNYSSNNYSSNNAATSRPSTVSKPSTASKAF